MQRRGIEVADRGSAEPRTFGSSARHGSLLRGGDQVLRAPEEGEILTSREARSLLRIGKTKLHEMTRCKAIPAFRIGSGRTSGLRYRRRDLLEWLYSQEVGKQRF